MLAWTCQNSLLSCEDGQDWIFKCVFEDFVLFIFLSLQLSTILHQKLCSSCAIRSSPSLLFLQRHSPINSFCFEFSENTWWRVWQIYRQITHLLLKMQPCLCMQTLFATIHEKLQWGLHKWYNDNWNICVNDANERAANHNHMQTTSYKQGLHVNETPNSAKKCCPTYLVPIKLHV